MRLLEINMQYNDHAGNCVNAHLNSQIEKLQRQLVNEQIVKKDCLILLIFTMCILLLVVPFLMWGVLIRERQYVALRAQAIDYGWIESFGGKDYPQIKLDKFKPLVSAQDKPLTAHFAGEVLDPMNKWNRFHIVIEPKWETHDNKTGE